MKKQTEKKASRHKRSPAKATDGRVSDLRPLDELAAEQGVGIVTPQRWKEMYGAGKHLWESDEEFDEFLKGIYERRQRGR